MLEQEFHFALMRAQNRANRLITRRMGDLGLKPGQPKVLVYLLEHDGSLARDICLGCALDKSTMTGLIAPLETAGLVVRAADAADRRAARISLTPAGRAMARRVRAILQGVDAILIEHADSDDLAAALRVLAAAEASARRAWEQEVAA